MKCRQCGRNNFNWAKRCDHCGHDFSNHKVPGDLADRGLRILTPTGAEIQLTAATSVQIDTLRICWSFGLQEWPGTTGKYGLICRKPDRELMAVKFQQVDVPMAKAPLVRFQNRVLIALALRGYLERGHQGFIMPCAYTRPKGDDRAETGIAYLVGPHPDFKSVSRELPDARWDAGIGDGATAMVADFARQVGRVVNEVPQGTSLGGGASVGQPAFLTMELRPVSALGSVDPRVAVLGPDVLVTMTDPESTFDSAWDFVAGAGFTSLPYACIVPVELRSDGSLHPL
jgi:hypothetical protein